MSLVRSSFVSLFGIFDVMARTVQEMLRHVAGKQATFDGAKRLRKIEKKTTKVPIACASFSFTNRMLRQYAARARRACQVRSSGSHKQQAEGGTRRASGKSNVVKACVLSGLVS